MKPVKEAKKYAKTFIQIMGEDEIPSGLAELLVIEKIMTKSREFRSLLVNPGFTNEERLKALKVVAERVRLSEKVVRFVMHLTEIRLVVALSEIIKMVTALYLEKKKRAKAVVMSPIAIGKDLEERLKASLKKLIAKDVEMEFVMDASLLGGVLIKVGSTMYDSSIKGQLRLLKDELIKG